MDGDVLLDRRAGRSGSRASRSLAAATLLARGVEPRLERLLALGLVGEAALGVVRGGVESLQRDEAFESLRSSVSVETKKAPALAHRGLQATVSCRRVRCVAICDLSIPRSRCSRSSCSLQSSEWWAHQDSNLERAGYEPAALTVELWARPESTVCNLSRRP